MKNFSYSGQSITFEPTEQVKSGQMHMLGSAFGIVSNAALSGQSTELFITGVWHLEKDESNFKTGDLVYFDPSLKKLTSRTATKDSTPIPCKLVGMAAENSVSTKTEFLCRLNGVTV